MEKIAPDILDRFIATYDQTQRNKISFDWNGKHAAEFVDVNQEFRQALLCRLLETNAKNDLLVCDVFLESAKWSRECWCAPFHFGKLGQKLLVDGGTDYLGPFLEGLFYSFDTFGSCHSIDLPADLIQNNITFLVTKRSQNPDAEKQKVITRGIDFFLELKHGTAKERFISLQPGTPVNSIRIVAPKNLRTYWLNLKQSVKELFR